MTYESLVSYEQAAALPPMLDGHGSPLTFVSGGHGTGLNPGLTLAEATQRFGHANLKATADVLLGDKTIDLKTVQRIVELTRQAGIFFAPEDPILGEDDDTVLAPDLVELIHKPDTTIATVEKDGKTVGFSLAVPIGNMKPTRAAETDTAYIYYTTVEPDQRGQGLVGPLMDTMTRRLQERGYGFVERDAVLAGGYADAVERNYGRYEGAIVAMHDHEKWPEIGPERFFRIDLTKLGQAATVEVA